MEKQPYEQDGWKRTHPDMHVLKEDQESLSNQLKVPACHGCIHLETQSDQTIMQKSD